MDNPHEPQGLRAVLRALKRRTKGLDDEAVDAVVEAWRGESDRGAIILAATTLEDRLQAAILGKMVNLNSDETSRLFGPDAPLGTFSAKIRLAQALGILERQEARAVDILREMRNACAHCRGDISFKQAELTNAAKAFERMSGLGEKATAKVTDRRFALMVHLVYLAHRLLGHSNGESAGSVVAIAAGSKMPTALREKLQLPDPPENLQRRKAKPRALPPQSSPR